VHCPEARSRLEERLAPIECNVAVRKRERQQRSREFGIKLAKGLRDRATEARREHDLDPRYVMLGAGDYLRQAAEAQINSPLDGTRVDPDERAN
jgi:hypothetical protein